MSITYIGVVCIRLSVASCKHMVPWHNFELGSDYYSQFNFLLLGTGIFGLFCTHVLGSYTMRLTPTEKILRSARMRYQYHGLSDGYARDSTRKHTNTVKL